MIETNEADKIMLYTQIALNCIELGELNDKVKNEILGIVDNNRLELYKEEIAPEDFERIKQDLQEVKAYITGQR